MTAQPEFDVERPFEARSQAAIAGLVTHPDPQLQMVGRLLATGLIDTVESWLKSERKRGSNIVDVISAYNAAHVQLLGSLVGSHLPKHTHEMFLDLFKDAFDKMFVTHCAKVAEHVKANPRSTE